MTKPLTIIIPLVTAVLGLSCQLFEDSNKTEPLRGRILFRVNEETYSGTDQPHDPYIAITIQTEYEYPCFNYGISYKFHRQSNDLEFTIYDVYIGGFCLTAPGPATLFMPVDLSAGEYTLVIHHEGSTNKHIVIVTDSSIVLRAGDTTISRPEDTLYWRVPHQSFYYSCQYYRDVNDGWACDAFLDTLRNLHFLSEKQIPDRGRWPYPPEPYFIYRREADYDSAGALLKRFSQAYLNYDRSASIVLTNWRQKRFASALFRN
jgi:hypothetical protein